MADVAGVSSQTTRGCGGAVDALSLPVAAKGAACIGVKGGQRPRRATRGAGDTA
jgi:hypothetical protein